MWNWNKRCVWKCLWRYRFVWLYDYPKDSKVFDPVNKKAIGKMAYQFKGKIYFLIDVDDEENKKAKEVNKNVVRNIRHILMFSLIEKVIRYKMKRIQGKLHKIGTYEVCKISLSSFDNKRYILDHGTNSLAYFHKDILRE